MMCWKFYPNSYVLDMEEWRHTSYTVIVKDVIKKRMKPMTTTYYILWFNHARF